MKKMNFVVFFAVKIQIESVLLKKTELLTNYHAVAINILVIQDVIIGNCKPPPVLPNPTSLNGCVFEYLAPLNCFLISVTKFT